jgi:hypothetical protein
VDPQGTPAPGIWGTRAATIGARQLPERPSMKKPAASTIAALALALPFAIARSSGLPAADFAYGFRSEDGSLDGRTLAAPAGTGTLSIVVYLTLTTGNNDLAVGAASWSFGLEVDGAAIDPATFAPVPPDTEPTRPYGLGITEDTLLDRDGNPATPPVAERLVLWDAPFAVLEPAVDEGAAGKTGAVSAIILGGMPKARNLPPNGTVDLARLVLSIPLASAPRTVTLKYRDGLTGTGYPVNNNVSVGSSSYVPTLGECRFEAFEAPTAAFIRGDANDDAKVDLSDAITILEWLFAGGHRPECPESADGNSDGRHDISDAMWLVGWQFLGREPPGAPFPACGVDPAAAAEACPPASTGCR